MKVRVLCVSLLALAVSFGVTGHASAVENCRASWYGPGFHGNDMANGKTYNQNDASVVAHKTYPFGTKLRVTRLDTGKHVIVVVQDRGPYHKGRCVDLSKAAATKLGIINAGTARVRVERL